MKVWFPTVHTRTGTEVFSLELAERLRDFGVETEVSSISHKSEYLPWREPVPECPKGTSVVHVNSWLHPRFIPEGLPTVATEHLCVHDPALKPYKSLLQKVYHTLWIKWVESQNFKRVSVVSAVSQYTAGIDPIVILNGVSLKPPFVPASRAQPKKPFRLLFASAWSKRKGADLLGDVMKELGPDFELICLVEPVEKVLTVPFY